MSQVQFQGWRRLLLAIALGLLPPAGSGFELAAAEQVSPGHVRATITLEDSKPPDPKSLLLRLDDRVDVRASKVESIAAPAGPMWLLIALDHSGSMGSAAIADIKAAVTTAVTGGASQELPYKVGVMAFGSRSLHLLTFTDRSAPVRPALAALSLERGADGKTRLFDAIAGGLATLRSERAGAKRLVVVSDGKDEGSTLSAEALGRLAQTPSNPIPIDTISYGAQAKGNSGSLSSVAGSTGGRFVQAANARELGDALRRMLQDGGATARYAVSFDYSPAADQRLAQSALLAYTAEVGPASRRPLTVAVAAPAAVAAEAPASTPGNQASAPDGSNRDDNALLRTLMAWLRGLSGYLAWIMSAVLAFAVLLLVLNRRKAHSPEPIPYPAPTVAPPPPPPPPATPRRPATRIGHAWPVPRPGQPTAILRGVEGPARGAQYRIEKPVYRVGCAPENDLVLIGDNFASGAHALIRAEASALYVEDLGSLNGSFLNGVEFKSATRALSPGDELRFGHTTFEVMPGTTSQAALSGLEPPAR
jgi:Inner membrane component of T3SS, cytoplasmic domain/von Willebrand factor type A domain